MAEAASRVGILCPWLLLPNSQSLLQQWLCLTLSMKMEESHNLPQQHVFWAITPPHKDLVAIAIQFEQEAFFPKKIHVPTKTVPYRRKNYLVSNGEDFWRHEVFHSYCGTGDIHQVMVKGNVLFGIDAADCRFRPPLFQDCWKHFLEQYQTHDPVHIPVLREMMQRIAEHPELPDLVEQERANAPGPILKHLSASHYGDNLREMHNSLVQSFF